MLDRYQRAMVESIKDADTLKITVGGVESKTSNSASTCAGSTSTNSVTM